MPPRAISFPVRIEPLAVTATTEISTCCGARILVGGMAVRIGDADGVQMTRWCGACASTG